MRIKKEEALQYIAAVAEQNVLTKSEVLTAFDGASKDVAQPATVPTPKKFGASEMLYYIGGLIVFFGLATLVAQNWFTFGLTTKLLVTLGAGVAAYVVGWLFDRDERTVSASVAFYLIAALATPIGLYVLLDAWQIDVGGSYGMQTLMSAIMLGIFGLSLIFNRKNLFILLSVIFGTWLFFSVTSLMVWESMQFNSLFYYYRFLVAGVAYMLLGYAFSKDRRATISGPLYGFGSLGVLGAGFALCFDADQGAIWTLLYAGLLFGALFLSIYLKSKAVLTWATLFLMAYILRLTAEYFSDTIGWPVALVFTGLALIAVGYMSISIRRKYLSK